MSHKSVSRRFIRIDGFSSLSHTHTRSHTHTQYTYTHSQTHKDYATRHFIEIEGFSRSPTHTHTHYIHTFSNTLSLFYTLSLKHTHTHTHVLYPSDLSDIDRNRNIRFTSMMKTRMPEYSNTGWIIVEKRRPSFGFLSRCNSDLLLECADINLAPRIHLYLGQSPASTGDPVTGNPPADFQPRISRIINILLELEEN